MDLTIINQNGKLLVDSREVAEMIGKKHAHLMRDIQGYEKVISENPKLDSQDFFIKDTYKVKGNNKTYDCYKLTKKGCDMVANKMTGEKGVLFTAIYVTKFEDMENTIKNGQNPLPEPLSPIEQLRLQYQVLEEHNKKLEVMEKKVNDNEEKITELEGNLPLLGIDCEELVKEVKKTGVKYLGYGTPAYKDKSTRMKVYTDIYSQIKREFGVNSYKALKRIQLSKALEFIKIYKLPTVLAEKIAVLNSQVSMEV